MTWHDDARIRTVEDGRLRTILQEETRSQSVIMTRPPEHHDRMRVRPYAPASLKTSFSGHTEDVLSDMTLLETICYSLEGHAPISRMHQ